MTDPKLETLRLHPSYGCPVFRLGFIAKLARLLVEAANDPPTAASRQRTQAIGRLIHSLATELATEQPPPTTKQGIPIIYADLEVVPPPSPGTDHAVVRIRNPMPPAPASARAQNQTRDGPIQCTPRLRRGHP